MLHVDLYRPTTPRADPPPTRLRDRLCARFGRVCGLLRLAHDGRVPF